jgi:hypothetical protein
MELRLNKEMMKIRSVIAISGLLMGASGAIAEPDWKRIAVEVEYQKLLRFRCDVAYNSAEEALACYDGKKPLDEITINVFGSPTYSFASQIVEKIWSKMPNGYESAAMMGQHDLINDEYCWLHAQEFSIQPHELRPHERIGSISYRACLANSSNIGCMITRARDEHWTREKLKRTPVPTQVENDKICDELVPKR